MTTILTAVQIPNKTKYQLDIGDPFEYLEAKYPDGGAGLHNSIFRGKNLGSAPTTEQYNNIKNGTFKGIWLGDYWSNSSVIYRNAGCDQFYNIGDSNYNTHHVVVLTDNNVLNANGTDAHYMQNDNTIPANGYIGTKMWTDTLPNSVLPVFQKVFGDHLFTHRELLCSSASDGKGNGWAWTDVTVNIPNQVMVYGTQAWIQPDYNSVGYQIGSRHQILPLFIARPDLVINRENYWLSDITSSETVADVNNNGNAVYDSASYPWSGVRPYALIKG